MAASVGVKMPKRMPPTMMTGVISDRNAALERRPEVRPREGLVAREATPPGEPRHHQRQGHGHGEAGQESGGEELADRGARHHAVDHHRQRGRDDRPDGGRRRRDADREARIVARVAHRLDLDRPEPARVGHRGATHAREDDGGADVHLAQAPRHPADERAREAEDALGDAGGVHQVAREDEERHRQQREAVHPVHHAVRHHHLGHLPREQDEGGRGRGQRHPHRHADQDLREEGHQQEDDQHRPYSIRGADSTSASGSIRRLVPRFRCRTVASAW